MADTAQLMDSLKAQLAQVKSRYQAGGIGGVLQSSLADNQQLLESWYNTLLEQKGVLSADQKAKLEADLDSSKKQLLEQATKNTKTTMIIIGISAVLITVAIIYFIKHKKHHAQAAG